MKIPSPCLLGLATAVLAPAVFAGDPPSPTIGDLAFMTGAWRATHDGDRLEEHFTGGGPSRSWPSFTGREERSS